MTDARRQLAAIAVLIFVGASIGFSAGLLWAMPHAKQLVAIGTDLDLIQRVQNHQFERTTFQIEESTRAIIQARIERCSL